MPPDARDNKLRILLVDDMEPVLAMLEDGLKQFTYEVVTATSGLEAAKVFSEKPPDAVVCDLGMPGIRGWEVTRLINAYSERTSATKPPFILLTGWDGQVHKEEKMSEEGLDAVLEKPEDIAILMDTIGRVSEFNKDSSSEDLV